MGFGVGVPGLYEKICPSLILNTILKIKRWTGCNAILSIILNTILKIKRWTGCNTILSIL